MPIPLTAGLAPGIQLRGSYIVRVTALNPTTGATVTGVKISDVSLQVDTIEPATKVALLPPIYAHT